MEIKNRLDLLQRGNSSNARRLKNYGVLQPNKQTMLASNQAHRCYTTRTAIPTKNKLVSRPILIELCVHYTLNKPRHIVQDTPKTYGTRNRHTHATRRCVHTNTRRQQPTDLPASVIVLLFLPALPRRAERADGIDHRIEIEGRQVWVFRLFLFLHIWSNNRQQTTTTTKANA